MTHPDNFGSVILLMQYSHANKLRIDQKNLTDMLLSREVRWHIGMSSASGSEGPGFKPR